MHLTSRASSSAKRSQLKNYKNALTFDLGGTKLGIGVVDRAGNVLCAQKHLVDLQSGFDGLIDQMTKLSRPLIKKYDLQIASIASAGPLDPDRGVLLNPTNLKSKGKSWGVAPLVDAMRHKVGMPVLLENDAAAAVLAEQWVGGGQGAQNLVAVTLGTGLGVGVIANGQLVRAGRGLHTEFGHITLFGNDKTIKCGCGNFGCAEAWLSGFNFTKYLSKKWKKSSLNGEALALLLKKKDRRAVQELSQYGERLAQFLYSIVVTFCPEKILLSGGFSSLYPFFEDDLNRKLLALLKTRRQGVDLVPEVIQSELNDHMGLIGAAAKIFYPTSD